MPLVLPHELVNGEVADATQVNENFAEVRDYVNTEVIRRDGLVAMQAPLNLVGDPTQSDHAANKGYVDNIVPVGVMMVWPGPLEPIGNNDWLLCDGRALAISSYPALHGVLGTRYGSGTGTFMLPNLKGRVVIALDAAETVRHFNDLGHTGGTWTSPIKAHTHTITHDHGVKTSSSVSGNHEHSFAHNATTAAGGAHDHAVSYVQDLAHAGGDGARLIGYVGGGLHADTGPASPATHTHTVAVSGTTGPGNLGTHSHTVNLDNWVGASGSTGSDPEHVPPFIVLNYLIKAR